MSQSLRRGSSYVFRSVTVTLLSFWYLITNASAPQVEDVSLKYRRWHQKFGLDGYSFVAKTCRYSNLQFSVVKENPNKQHCFLNIRRHKTGPLIQRITSE